MRKLLMISHGYPPVGGSGMLRTLKFSRYLPGHGWQPVVLALRRTKHPRLDPRLQAEVPPGTAVYRSPAPDALRILVRLRGWLRLGRFGRGNGDGMGGAGKGASAASIETGGGGLADALKDLLTIPDNYAGWYLPGLLYGLWAVLRKRPRVIFSTSPPPTAHMIASTLARLTGLPWVADFRDPWTLQFACTDPGDRKARWNRRLEARVIRRASKVICNTEPMAAAFREAYPWAEPGKFEVITNGFDPADFREAPDTRDPGGPFLFLHTGEFFPSQNLRVPDPFLLALRELFDAGTLFPADVKVRLVGSGEYTDMEPFLRLMESPALSEVVEVIDFLPHDEIPAQLAGSDALLLFQNGAEFYMQIPAKTFEYIRAGRPILAVSAEGATADIVRSVEGGRSVLPEDMESLKAAILEMLSMRGRNLERRPEELERFSRPGLTQSLARLLDGVAGLRSAPSEGSAGMLGGEGAKRS